MTPIRRATSKTCGGPTVFELFRRTVLLCYRMKWAQSARDKAHRQKVLRAIVVAAALEEVESRIQAALTPTSVQIYFSPAGSYCGGPRSLLNCVYCTLEYWPETTVVV